MLDSIYRLCSILDDIIDHGQNDNTVEQASTISQIYVEACMLAEDDH
jgi:hypothetical protein